MQCIFAKLCFILIFALGQACVMQDVLPVPSDDQCPEASFTQVTEDDGQTFATCSAQCQADPTCCYVAGVFEDYSDVASVGSTWDCYFYSTPCYGSWLNIASIKPNCSVCHAESSTQSPITVTIAGETIGYAGSEHCTMHDSVVISINDPHHHQTASTSASACPETATRTSTVSEDDGLDFSACLGQCQEDASCCFVVAVVNDYSDNPDVASDWDCYFYPSLCSGAWFDVSAFKDNCSTCLDEEEVTTAHSSNTDPTIIPPVSDSVTQQSTVASGSNNDPTTDIVTVTDNAVTSTVNNVDASMPTSSGVTNNGLIDADRDGLHFHCNQVGHVCNNGGVCDTSGKCNCGSNFAGYACDEDVGGMTKGISCSEQCNNGGICYSNSGSEKCVCGSDFIGNVCEDNRVKIDCTVEQIIISFAAVAPFTGLVHVGNNQDNSSCQLIKNQNGVYSGEFPLDTSCDGFEEPAVAGSKGTKYKKELHIQYNDLYVDNTDLVINVSCVMSKNDTQESQGGLGQPLDSSEAGGGKVVGGEISTVFKPALLAVWTNPGMAAISTSVSLGQRVFLVNYIGDSSVFKTLVVERCTATDPDNAKTVTILEQGCPAQKAQRLFFGDAERITSPPGVRHDIKIFKLYPNTKRLTFSCIVKMCEELNEASCQLRDNCDANTRRKREAETEEGILLLPDNEQETRVEVTITEPNTDGIDTGSDGEILTNRDSKTSTSTDSPAVITTMVTLGSVSCVLLVACVILVVCLFRFRSAQLKERRPTVQLRDGAYDNPWFDLPRARHDRPDSLS